MLSINPTYILGADLRSIITVGGAMNIHVMRDTKVDAVVFQGNSAIYGGAMRIVHPLASSEINHSRFLQNQGHYGGALSVYTDMVNPSTSLTLNNNIFIGNTVTGRRMYGDAVSLSAYGGAVEVYNQLGSFTFHNNVFLVNLATNESESGLSELNGWGGAMAVRAYSVGDQSITISSGVGCSPRT